MPAAYMQYCASIDGGNRSAGHDPQSPTAQRFTVPTLPKGCGRCLAEVLLPGSCSSLPLSPLSLAWLLNLLEIVAWLSSFSFNLICMSHWRCIRMSAQVFQRTNPACIFEAGHGSCVGEFMHCSGMGNTISMIHTALGLDKNHRTLDDLNIHVSLNYAITIYQ